jgi:hypothetical protein
MAIRNSAATCVLFKKEMQWQMISIWGAILQRHIVGYFFSVVKAENQDIIQQLITAWEMD